MTMTYLLLLGSVYLAQSIHALKSFLFAFHNTSCDLMVRAELDLTQP